MHYLAAFIGLSFLVILLFSLCMRRITVFEYEKALKYTRGKFSAVLPPGVHWYVPLLVSIHKIDVRPRFVSITGQEVLSSDGVALKVSLAANFEIADPNMAVNKVQSFEQALHLELQLAVREIIGAVDIDTVLNTRAELSKKLVAITSHRVEELGLKLLSVNLKDIMFPGKLKEIFAQVVNARKEGLAALEKARGETAALRNLANAAKMIESNPNLMQLRLVQALGGSSGNTLILGMPPQTVALPIRLPDAHKGKDPHGEPQEEPEHPD